MRRSIRSAIFTLVLVVSAYAGAAPSEIHVALLGDSLAHGVGDEAGKGIAGRIEPELRSRGVAAIHTTNLGKNGATTRDLVARLADPATRAVLGRADAIVLSIGANDVRPQLLGEEPLRSPVVLVDEVLRNLDTIVAELRRINPGAQILILGAYTPVPYARAAVLLEPIIAIWDASIMARYADDPRTTLVRMSDIVDRPERLSRLDSFHPGGEAYQEAARRIAELLAKSTR